MNEPDNFYKPFFRNLILAEWVLMIFTAAVETIQRGAFDHFFEHHNILRSLGFLTALGVVQFLPILERSKSAKIAYVFLEILLAAGAAFFGVHRFFFLLFGVIITKAALLTGPRVLATAIASSVLIHFGITEWKRHINISQNHVVPKQSAILITTLSVELEMFFVIGLVLVAFIARALASERKSRREAERLAQDVHSLATALERTRIARDLHDSLGHTLTSLKIQIDVARKLHGRDSEKSKEALENATELAGKGLSDVRSIVRSMRDSDFDFRGELDSLLENFEKSNPIKVDLSCEVAKLPDPIGHQLFCIVQECLTNVQRHAQATVVAIKFQKAAEKVLVEIRDNGQGFVDSGDQDGFGIKGMRERAQSIGGTFAIESSPKQGTKISVCVPGI